MGQENTGDDKKGWSIGDIISMLFGSALVVGVVGWIASSGIFGEQISAAIKSFVNQFLPNDMQFDDGKPMENYLRETAKNQDEFAALLQSDAFGPGLSPETAKAIAGEASAFIDALKNGLGEGGLENLVMKAGNLTFDTKLVTAMAASGLSVGTKELLFAEMLEKQGLSETAADSLASNPDAIVKIMAAAEKNGSSLTDILTTFGAVGVSGDLSALVKLFGDNNEVFRTLIESFDNEQIQTILAEYGEQMQLGANLLKSGNNLQIVDGVIQNLKAANLYDADLLGQVLGDSLAGNPLSPEANSYLLKVGMHDVSILQPLLDLDLSALPEGKRDEVEAVLSELDPKTHVDRALDSEVAVNVKGVVSDAWNSIFGGDTPEDGVAVQPVPNGATAGAAQLGD